MYSYNLGSGGAVIGLLTNEGCFQEMKRAYEEEGFVVVKVIPNFDNGKGRDYF
jgi:hypothetical protein